MKKIVCLYQICQHKVGNCKICIADEKNKLCENYIPLTLFSFEAKGGEICSTANTTK